MLILNRNPGQKIIINNDIEILYLGCRNGTGRIAITAPEKTKIVSEETKDILDIMENLCVQDEEAQNKGDIK